MYVATAMTAVAAGALPALADVTVHVGDKGAIAVGVPMNDSGSFGRQDLYGARFTLGVDVTIGSGYGLTVDSFGTFDLSGADSELALYNTDGTFLFAINDDYDSANPGDAYLSFGDAAGANNPYNGLTQQGVLNNATELLAGTYVAVIGPFNTTWDSFDWSDSSVNNGSAGMAWLCSINLFVVPAPGSLALLGLGGLAVCGTRRRRN